jgi:hypothetical protein
MSSNLNYMLNHAILTESICQLVRQGGNVNRFGLNNNDITMTNNTQDDDEDTYEYWSFGFTENVGEKLQIQAVTCLTCGDYILDSIGLPKCQNARCMCPHELDDEATYEQNRADAKAKNELINNYYAFDVFVMEMLPDRLISQDPVTKKISIFQDYPDRLCEDVIGEISRFLV